MKIPSRDVQECSICSEQNKAAPEYFLNVNSFIITRLSDLSFLLLMPSLLLSLLLSVFIHKYICIYGEPKKS